MTIKQLCNQLSKAEGKKHQASVGDVRELIALLSDMLYTDSQWMSLYNTIVENGRRRSKKIKIKAKKK